jgi:hypothetical protein
MHANQCTVCVYIVHVRLPRQGAHIAAVHEVPESALEAETLVARLVCNAFVAEVLPLLVQQGMPSAEETAVSFAGTWIACGLLEGTIHIGDKWHKTHV